MGVAYIAMDSGLGRKYSIVLGFVLFGVSCGVLYFLGVGYLIFLSACAKFMSAILFIVNSLYSSEVYETHNRVAAIGFLGGTGRIGGSIFASVLIYASGFGLLVPFLVISV